MVNVFAPLYLYVKSSAIDKHRYKYIVSVYTWHLCSDYKVCPLLSILPVVTKMLLQYSGAQTYNCR